MSTEYTDLERQVNLTFAFLSADAYSRRFLTTTWIRDNVDGYQGTSDDAFRKKFQRDLTDLRRVGVPIEQVASGSGAGNSPTYRLQRSNYELPEISFTPEEATVLGLAGEMGQSLELAAFTRSGWTKIAAGGASRDLREPVSVTHAGDLRSLTPDSLDTILRAVRRGERVQFSYRSSRALPPVTRTMDVWGLVPLRDRIYLVGYDPERDGVRSFRITRVCDITLVRPATHPMPDGTDLQGIVRDSLRRDDQLVDALVRVEPDRAAALISRGVEESPGIWRLTDVDRDWLIRTAAAHAPAAIVLEPVDVRADVIALLHKVVK